MKIDLEECRWPQRVLDKKRQATSLNSTFIPGPMELQYLKLVEVGSLIPLVLQRIDVEIQCDAFLSQTKVTTVWLNDRDSKFEAELSFPLPEGGAVCGYAVDIDGKLVPGVIVSKEKARATFEAEVRKDRGGPAIIEQSVGNIFTTRINPFLPKGTRTIQVTFTHDLIFTKSNQQGPNFVSHVYTLPFLTPPKPIRGSLDIKFPGKFSVDFPIGATLIDASTGNPTTWKRGRSSITGQYELSFSYSSDQFRIIEPLSFTITGSTEDSSLVIDRTNSDSISFAASVRGIPLHLATSQSHKSTSYSFQTESIGLLWDTSRSHGADTKAIQAEVSFLSSLLQHQPFNQYAVSLYTFNAQPDLSPINFKAGSSSELSMHILSSGKVKYHGGTNYSSLDSLVSTGSITSFLSAYKFWIIVTDGLSTFGSQDLPQLNAPVYLFSAASSGDHSLLRKWARKSNGKFFNLGRVSVQDVVTAFGDSSMSYLYTSLNGVPLVSSSSLMDEEKDEIHSHIITDQVPGWRRQLSVVPGIPESLKLPSLQISGRIHKSSGAFISALKHEMDSNESSGKSRVELVFHFGLQSTGTVLHSVSFPISISNIINRGVSSKVCLSERTWAKSRISEISELIDLIGKSTENEEKSNLESEQTALAKQFYVVTPNTSLIVLETLQQYLDHMICPPKALPDIYKQYCFRIAARMAEEESKRFEKLSRVHQWWQRRQKWADLNENVHHRPRLPDCEIAFRTYGVSPADYKANRQILHLFEYGGDEMNDLPITRRDAYNQQWHFAPPESKIWPTSLQIFKKRLISKRPVKFGEDNSTIDAPDLISFPTKPELNPFIIHNLAHRDSALAKHTTLQTSNNYIDSYDFPPARRVSMDASSSTECSTDVAASASAVSKPKLAKLACSVNASNSKSTPKKVSSRGDDLDLFGSTVQESELVPAIPVLVNNDVPSHTSLFDDDEKNMPMPEAPVPESKEEPSWNASLSESKEQEQKYRKRGTKMKKQELKKEAKVPKSSIREPEGSNNELRGSSTMQPSMAVKLKSKSIKIDALEPPGENVSGCCDGGGGGSSEVRRALSRAVKPAEEAVPSEFKPIATTLKQSFRGRSASPSEEDALQDQREEQRSMSKTNNVFSFKADSDALSLPPDTVLFNTPPINEQFDAGLPPAPSLQPQSGRSMHTNINFAYPHSISLAPTDEQRPTSTKRARADSSNIAEGISEGFSSDSGSIGGTASSLLGLSDNRAKMDPSVSTRSAYLKSSRTTQTARKSTGGKAPRKDDGKLQKAQRSIKKTKKLMEESVDSVLNQGERLEDMTWRSQDLQFQASRFKQSSTMSAAALPSLLLIFFALLGIVGSISLYLFGWWSPSLWWFGWVMPWISSPTASSVELTHISNTILSDIKSNSTALLPNMSSNATSLLPNTTTESWLTSSLISSYLPDCTVPEASTGMRYLVWVSWTFMTVKIPAAISIQLNHFADHWVTYFMYLISFVVGILLTHRFFQRNPRFWQQISYLPTGWSEDVYILRWVFLASLCLYVIFISDSFWVRGTTFFALGCLYSFQLEMVDPHIVFFVSFVYLSLVWTVGSISSSYGYNPFGFMVGGASCVISALIKQHGGKMTIFIFVIIAILHNCLSLFAMITQAILFVTFFIFHPVSLPIVAVLGLLELARRLNATAAVEELDAIVAQPIFTYQTEITSKSQTQLSEASQPSTFAKMISSTLTAEPSEALDTSENIDYTALPTTSSPMLNMFDLIQFERPQMALIDSNPSGLDSRKLNFRFTWPNPAHPLEISTVSSAVDTYELLCQSNYGLDATAEISKLYQIASCLLDASIYKPQLVSSAISAASSLTEIHLGKVQLLRAIAYKLESIERLEDATHLYRRILFLRGEEPQSYRDLAIVLAKQKKYSECLTLFNSILTRHKPDWDVRFSQIEVVSLMDLCGIIPFMNQLDVASGIKIPLSIAPVVTKPIQAELRAVLTWDVDGLDLELQVHEPNGELLTSFSNSSNNGGMLSRDFSGGYGPVEYLARRVISGGYYTFRAKVRSPCTKPILGGDVTIRFEVWTEFGNAEQQKYHSTVCRIAKPSYGQLINLVTVSVK